MRLWVLFIAFALASACGGSTSEPTEPSPPPSPSPPPPDDDVAGTAPCEEPPPGPGYECVQDCGPPVATEGDPPPGYSWLSPEDARNRRQFGCPICLPEDALIATPRGAVAVARLTPGELVWSYAEDGTTIATQVLRVASTRAPADHAIAVVALADGRVVRASPGHPVADGRAIGSLVPGDPLDGSVVVRAHRVPYQGSTYDLVLDDDRALYASDGVVLRSTLAR